MPEVLENKHIISSSNYERVRSEISNVETGLSYGNPILQVHTGQIDAFAHAYRGISLDELPLVQRTNLTSTSNPDTQLKPFDIIKRPLQIGVGNHSAIYLGNGKVAHVYGTGFTSSGAASDYLGVNAVYGSLAGSHAALRHVLDTQGAHIGN